MAGLEVPLRERIAVKLEGVVHRRNHEDFLDAADSVLADPELDRAVDLYRQIPPGTEKYCNNSRVCSLMVHTFPPRGDIVSHCPFSDRELIAVHVGQFNGMNVDAYLKCDGCRKPFAGEGRE